MSLPLFQVRPIEDDWFKNEHLFSVLKNMPEILTEFNILTAMATMEFNATNIQTDKCKEINQQLENFYSEQVATTATAAATIQKRSGKSPISIDPFLVKFSHSHFLSLHVSYASSLQFQF